VQAFKDGAVDFLTEPVNDEQLVAAIRVAFEKNRIARRERAELSEILARIATLSPRQKEVMKHVVTAKLNKQIAHDLAIDLHTLKVHRGRMMEKMKVQSVAELVRLAARSGIRETTEQQNLA
jgi:FixJ family two-component response regulator